MVIGQLFVRWTVTLSRDENLVPKKTKCEKENNEVKGEMGEETNG